MESTKETGGGEPSDEELMRRVGSRDVRALEILVNRHRQRAYKLALGMVGDREGALDISQEAFIRVYRSARRFQTDRRFLPWFYSILRNRALTFLRKRSARREVTGLDFPFETGEADPRESADLKRAVWNAVGRLPENHREIIVLRHFHDMSYGEIAELLSIPAGTVMSRLYAARRLLRAELEGEFS